MRVFITVLVLIFSLQSWSKADDIRDFEIEGISIGDSLLDFFSEEEIKKNIRNDVLERINDKTFILSEFQHDPLFNKYEAVQFLFKRDDKKYEIHGILGAIFFKKNIKDCYIKMNEIALEISTNIDYLKKDDFNDLEFPGRGVYSGITFFLNKGIISVHCYDWSTKTENEKKWIDNLRVNIKTDELEDFLRKKD